jgi:sugar lactone lactonase YvrE
LLASGSRDGTLRLWDVAEGELANLIKTENQVSGVAFSADSSKVAAAGHRGIRVWQVAGAAPITTVGNWGSGSNAVAFSPDGTRLAAGGDDYEIKVGTLEGNPNSIGKHRSIVRCVAFRPDGKRLASAGKDFIIRLWNVELGAEAKTFEGHTSCVNSLAFSPDGQVLVSGSEDNTVRIWPLK